MSRYQGEQVLVIPRSIFVEVGYFQGVSFNATGILEAAFSAGAARFMDREEAEKDPSYKQLIPYGIFHYGSRLLHYTRGGSGGEARLYDKGSIGIGGHINPVDQHEGTITMQTYLSGVEREVREELSIEGEPVQHIIGAINDDTNEVGSVHLGIVHVFDMTSCQVKSNESALANLAFQEIDDLESPQMHSKLETWSQLALRLYRHYQVSGH